jgi:TolB-like protein/Flp pilus assembly protein TadD
MDTVADGPVCFEGFVFDPLRGALFGPDGAQIALRPKTYAALQYFLANRGRLVGRNELLDAVWPGLFVSDDSITQCVAEIRRALGEHGRRVLRTVPTRGYLLESPGRPVPAAQAPPSGAGAGGPLAARAVTDGASTPAAEGAPSIAILPFENLSPDQANGYFVNGITDDLITGLSRFRSLSVTDRHSSFQFAGLDRPPRESAQRLGVRYLLGGSIRIGAARIRISTQLIDTGAHRTIWAEQYDAALNDVLAIEDSIVQVIVARLAGEVHSAERDRLRRNETSDLQAYGHVLRGEELLLNVDRDRNTGARALFARALALDADYARAFAGLSRTHNLDWRYGWVADAEAALERAIDFARLAVAKDPRDARAHSELGFAHLYRREIDASLTAYARALELNPNDADVMSDYADALAYADRSDEAIAWMQRAMRLNPFCPDSYFWHLADIHYGMGRYADTIATIQRMHDPGRCSRLLAACCAHLGRLDEARMHAAEVLRRQPDFRVSAWAAIVPDARPERTKRFAAGLVAAGLPE